MGSALFCFGGGVLGSGVSNSSVGESVKKTGQTTVVMEAQEFTLVSDVDVLFLVAGF